MGMLGSVRDNPTVIRAGRAYVTIGDDTTVAIGIQVQFQRTVNRLPTLSRSNILTVSEPQGTLTINSLVMSGKGSVWNSITGTDCTPATVKLSYGNDDDCNQAQGSLTLSGALASAISLSGDGSQGYIANGVTFTFTDMDNV